VLLAIQNAMWQPNFRVLPKPVVAFLSGCLTFALVCIGWVIFRADSVGDAYSYLLRSIVELDIPDTNRSGVIYVLAALTLDFIWRKDTRLESVNFMTINWSRNSAMALRWSTYVVMFWAVIVAMSNRSGIEQFIYFQF